MAALKNFLFDHEGHELVFSEDSEFDGTDWQEIDTEDETKNPDNPNEHT